MTLSDYLVGFVSDFECAKTTTPPPRLYSQAQEVCVTFVSDRPFLFIRDA